MGCSRIFGQQVACHIIKGDLEMELVKMIMEVPVSHVIPNNQPLKKVQSLIPLSCRLRM